MSPMEEGNYAMMNDKDVDWEYGTQWSYDEGHRAQGGQVNSVAGAWDSSAPWNSSCGSAGPEASWTQGQERERMGSILFRGPKEAPLGEEHDRRQNSRPTGFALAEQR